MVDVRVNRTDASTQEASSSKGVSLNALAFAELGRVKPLQHASPELLLVTELPVATSAFDQVSFVVMRSAQGSQVGDDTAFASFDQLSD